MEHWLILGKLIDDDGWCMRKVDWSGKLIDQESQLTEKVDWQEKLMNLGFGHGSLYVWTDNAICHYCN